MDLHKWQARLAEGGEMRARLREGGERRARKDRVERGELYMYIG